MAQDAVLPDAEAIAEIERGLEIWARFNVEMPTEQPVIVITSTEAHHISRTASTLAWQDGDGLWQLAQIRQLDPWGSIRTEYELLGHDSQMLDTALVERLEALLQSASVYDAYLDRTGTPATETSYHTMQIISDHGQITLDWGGLLAGPEGEIADIVLSI
ncbi:hypothetical protein [Aurantiacibacter sp. MUD61]|uniref:hypothetical protein n=1 Tax=Aurantiacibacter sp. MUD61 TaxID=3009083 RepID=UPI0022EFDC91|nr:hypothetical protein [Aurantiacibacter sp. MUD61]